MRRKVVSNDKYVFAFGVDHAPGGERCFFDIWERVAEGEDPLADEGELPHVEADEVTGVAAHNRNTLERNPALVDALNLFRTDLFPEHESMRDHTKIIAVAVALGFDSSKVAPLMLEVWDK